MININKAIFIVAHPDDETLGCGGTIIKLLKQNIKIKLLIMTDGISSRNDSENMLNKRKNQAITAIKKLGIKDYKFFDFPDNSMDTVPILSIAKSIENEIFSFKPDTVFTHFIDYLNQDHKIVSQATLIATRPPSFDFIKNVLYFETASSTDWSYSNSFHPNLFIEISNEIKLKIAVLKLYKTELKKFPHQRSIENISNLSKYRGSIVFKKYVEAFQIIRSTF